MCSLCCTIHLFIILMRELPPRSTLFPYTTLFRSELEELVKATIQELGASSKKEMGPVIKAVQAKAAGRADGKSISADRKSTRLNSSHLGISYAVFCLKKKKQWQYVYAHAPNDLPD